MPTYEYKCSGCDHKLEKFQSFSESPLTKCPECKEDKLYLLISGGLGFSIHKGGSTSIGGHYVPMDSAEQKLDQRLSELTGGQ